MRDGKGWTPLGIVIVARTDESNLSSTAIRQWKYEEEQKKEKVEQGQQEQQEQQEQGQQKEGAKM